MVDLVFTSELALKRSIRKKYPGLSAKQREATFEQQKQYIGIELEKYLDMKYEDYKKSLE
mgnify:CR=1 FL=1